ncbi:MAG TPA: RNA polymerase sigma factor [Acidimicrobiales bacterium]|nr:RNA polymerase sigma factor [Acidimicrobiales bacterium]
MTGDDTDAQDALQDALIAVARGIRGFDGRSSFSTWSYRVATNACLDELRRRRRRPVPTALGGGTAGDGDEGGGGAGRGLDPLERVGTPGGPVLAGGRAGVVADGGIGAVDGRLDVDAALARVPDPYRAAVVLRDVCDLDYAEIARVLDIPVGTVRSRIARGRALLSGLLGNPAAPSDRPTTSP